MKRFLPRFLIGLVLLIVVGAAFGLARGRPEFQAALDRLRAAWNPTEDESGAEEERHATPPEMIDDGWCSAHQRPEACRDDLPLIRLAGPDIAAQVGLKTAPAERRRHAHQVVGNAEISYVSHDYAHVTSRVAGIIADVPVDEGDTVKKGAVLVVVDSAEVGTAKASYLSILPTVDLAEVTYKRLESLYRENATARKEVLDARATLNKAKADLLSARQKLLTLGYSDADLDKIAKTNDTSNLLNLVAPMDGTLVERHAIAGEVVGPPSTVAVGQSGSLFDVVNLAHLWCWIDVYETEIAEVTLGQSVTFTISGTTEPVFRGKVTLIGYAVNPTTRTVRVRAELANPDGRLRAFQFGRAVIRVGSEHELTVVPRDAVQRVGDVDMVFLPQPDGVTFRPQRVVTREVDFPGETEIAWGVKPGQSVVTTGSFELKSELLRGEIAGD